MTLEQNITNAINTLRSTYDHIMNTFSSGNISADDTRHLVRKLDNGVRAILDINTVEASTGGYPIDDLSKLLEYHLSAIRGHMESARAIKSAQPELRHGYQVSPGGVLNAYREGDLSFDKACSEIDWMISGDDGSEAEGLPVTVSEFHLLVQKSINELQDEFEKAVRGCREGGVYAEDLRIDFTKLTVFSTGDLSGLEAEEIVAAVEAVKREAIEAHCGGTPLYRFDTEDGIFYQAHAVELLSDPPFKKIATSLAKAEIERRITVDEESPATITDDNLDKWLKGEMTTVVFIAIANAERGARRWKIKRG